MKKTIRDETQIARLTQYAQTHKSERIAELLSMVLEYGEINYADLGEIDNIAQPVEGLYLIGDPKFNPITKEEFYYVKTGLSYKGISFRMHDYKCHNPLVYKQNYLYTHHDLTDILEELTHIQLRNVGKKVEGTAEWFRVSRETYLEIMEKGFTYFSIKV